MTRVESQAHNLLGQLLARKRFTTTEFVKAFRETSAAMVERGEAAKQTDISWPQARRWLKGETSLPQPIACRVLEVMFQEHRVTAEELFGPPAVSDPGPPELLGQEVTALLCLPAQAVRAESSDGPTDMEEMTRMAAAESAAFGAFAEQSNVGPVTIEQLMADLERIVTEYPNRPIGPLFSELRALRNRAFTLLEGHQPPNLTIDLYVIAGTACAVLANASFDLGSLPAAKTQARTAMLCGEIAQHNGLRAWVRGLQALIAYWDDRYREAADYAEQGWHYVPEAGTARVRLASIEARARARLRDERGVRDALARAEQARERIRRPDELAGMLAFPVAKQAYSSANALLWVGGDANLVEAERLASESLQLYLADPPELRRLGEMSLARLDLAVARLHRRDLDGAAHQIELVLETGGNRRIESVGRRLNQIRIALERPYFQTASLALTLNERIKESPVASVRALTPGKSQ
ncbi:hypothetical protein [Nocardia sp. NPDC050435]|uniref:hypothetical protein n=1 Tax=Nocardia sp. NPDC050435 TaxID=3155040 RepID=UPI00340BD81F